VGEIGEPIEVGGEVHIFRLLGRESERNFAFEEVEAELAQWVQASKAEKRYREWVEELKKKHHIERRL
jgi:parvulin-like peptidyl-prolyl isomerase